MFPSAVTRRCRQTKLKLLFREDSHNYWAVDLYVNIWRVYTYTHTIVRECESPTRMRAFTKLLYIIHKRGEMTFVYEKKSDISTLKNKIHYKLTLLQIVLAKRAVAFLEHVTL